MNLLKKYKALVFVWIGFLFFIHSPVHAVTSQAVFNKYPNTYFIETGSFLGDGIQMALNVGFPQVYSIELSPQFYDHCLKRFADQKNVQLLLGDSSTVLPELLKTIEAPATFWLDGHYSWGPTARGKTNSPILAELEAIANHSIKTHTILIDDVRQFGTIEFDFIELEMIIAKIKTINPNYTISFEDGFQSNDVLVAEIR